MHISVSGLVTGFVLTAVLQAHAQGDSTPEDEAVIKDGEVGRLDRGSVSKAGPVTRFEASIVWDETGGAPPKGHMSRKVRYVADCKAGTLTLAAVKVFDPAGGLIKTTLVPPGAGDSVAPQSGSTEAQWLREACGR